jgi:hypothetical protein
LGFSSTGLPPEPKTIDAALSFPEGPHLKAAMQEELRYLQDLDTWESTSLPAECHAIPCMWAFKRKLNSDGTTERYKFRLIFKGFHQRYMIDYDHVFAPVWGGKLHRANTQLRGNLKRVINFYERL